MPPSFTAQKQVSFPEFRADVPPRSGLFAATKVCSAMNRLFSNWLGPGIEMAWKVTLEASSCLATYALPCKLSLKPGQRAILPPPSEGWLRRVLWRRLLAAWAEERPGASPSRPLQRR